MSRPTAEEWRDAPTVALMKSMGATDAAIEQAKTHAFEAIRTMTPSPETPVEVAEGVTITYSDAFSISLDVILYGNAYVEPAGDDAPEGVTHRRVDPSRIG